MPSPPEPQATGSPASAAGRSSAEWDADRYHRVSDPQAAWGAAVLDRLRLRGDETVVDAGCGTGRLTAALLDRLDGGRVIAVDRSVQMLRVAGGHTGGRAHRVQADLLRLPLRSCADVVFSTATFHWVLDHPRLFAEIHAALRPGGLLLAQCGGGPNLERIHGRAMSVLHQAPYAAHMTGWTRPWEFADAPTAAARLHAAGFVDVRTSVVAAPTVLDGPDGYGEFIRTVILRPHLAQLPEDLRDGFVDEMVRRGAGDDPPWSLDYWRLNLEGRRAA